MSSPYNSVYMYTISVLDNQLVTSVLIQSISPSLRFSQLSLGLCLELRPHKLSVFQVSMSIGVGHVYIAMLVRFHRSSLTFLVDTISQKPFYYFAPIPNDPQLDAEIVLLIDQLSLMKYTISCSLNFDQFWFSIVVSICGKRSFSDKK